jgi:HAE1 family hydrophobic/amphiphilic exporter-1
MNTNSPVRALCAALAIIALSLAVLLSDSGPGGAGPGKTFAVTIRHYGVDAREMERVCAIPLEDALSALPGLARIASTSEDGMVRVFLRFDGARPGQYEALREAVQGVYETLPSSCQRPVIATEDEARSPIWSAAVRLRDGSAGLSRLGLILEKTVKPALESLPGAGEVEIAGPGVPEVVVELDRGAAPLLGLRPDTVGAYLAERDLVLPGGSIIQGGREIYLPVEGRYDSAEDLREALVTAGEQYAGPLKSLARVYERERPADSLSRLDGQPAAYIAVIGAGSGTTSARRLSQAIKAATLQFADLEFEVLSDRGAEEEKSYRQVLKGMLQGAAAVALAIVFLQGKGRKNLLSLAISAAEAPVMLFVAAALLKALGTPLDKAALAGLAAGVGSAVDAVILGAPRSGVPRNEALREMKAVLPSLVSGAATTLAALMPLAFIDGGETRAIVLAIGSITFTALVFATVVMPPLLLWGKDRESGVGNRESKKILTSRQRSCRRLPTPVFSATELPPTPDSIDSRLLSSRQRSCRRLPILFLPAPLPPPFPPLPRPVLGGPPSGCCRILGGADGSRGGGLRCGRGGHQP